MELKELIMIFIIIITIGIILTLYGGSIAEKWISSIGNLIILIGGFVVIFLGFKIPECERWKIFFIVASTFVYFYIWAVLFGF